MLDSNEHAALAEKLNLGHEEHMAALGAPQAGLTLTPYILISLSP